jgi:alkylated DNA repair dioxygenase AlkB
MNTLFTVAPEYPPGFCYLPEFISAEEEAYFINICRQQELHTFRFGGYEAKRRVASFGQDWNFETQTLQQGNPVPGAFQPLILKVAAEVGTAPADFAELLVTHYPAGAVINWHRDAPPFDLVAGISLLTDCTFRLRPYDKAQQKRANIISFPVQRRSLYLMGGASRMDWQHSIAAVAHERYSITLRTLRRG